MQQQRFAAYLDSLARAAGHVDRAIPLRSYCTGLLLPGERKSIEPLAARLAPHDVRRVHQSLHHFVANAPWSDEALLERVRHSVLPMMKRNGPIVAWIVDDTGFPKKGTHSVGVVRQYCGQVGKQENCRVAVSLSLATEQASLPIAWRLYLPEIWAQDRKRRKETGIPREVPLPPSRRSRFSRFGKQWKKKSYRLPSWPMPPMATIANFEKGSPNWVWSMSSVFRNPRPSGDLEKLRGPRSGGKGGDARQNCCAGTNTINPFPLNNWRNRWQQALGKMFPGAKEPSRDSVRALQHCVFVWLIEIIGEANCLPRNGC